ncbi:MAG: nucleoside recognition protein [Tyzzerella sp.]|nr:nucleoside recognition protein [Tyzzerella sp.]
MLNFLWAGMIIIGVMYAAFTGNIAEVTNAALDSSKEAITLCLTMLGVMSFWMGLMEIATKAGIVGALSRFLRPVVRFMFPNIPKRHKANEHITTNLIANILGLGWAATPAGLQAMEALGQLEEERGNDRSIASDEMCTFLIVNISSLQLININIIAYRSQYGSVNPTRIVGAGIVATIVSTIVGCLYCKMKNRGVRR